MGKYLLDTSVIVNLFRGKTKINEEIFENGVSVSAVTMAELYYGASKSQKVERNMKQIADFVTDFDIKVIDFDDRMGKVFGVLKASLETGGTRLEDLDLMIAATALVTNKTLVTENTKHFGRIKRLEITKAVEN